MSRKSLNVGRIVKKVKLLFKKFVPSLSINVILDEIYLYGWGPQKENIRYPVFNFLLLSSQLLLMVHSYSALL